MSTTEPGVASVRPFQIDVPQPNLDELQGRLAATRFTDELPGADYGVSVERLRRLVSYWVSGYDWRTWEAALNRHPHFVTEIDGQRIHFLGDQLLGEELDDDFVLTNAAVYWFTGTAGSSIRLYFENARSGHRPSQPTTVPIALAMAEGDFKSIRRFCDRDHENIVSWRQLEPPARGHYTAHTATEALTDDIRRFFTDLGG